MESFWQTFNIKLYSVLLVVWKILKVVVRFLNSIVNTAVYKNRKKIEPLVPHPTLRFHPIHGANIELKENRTVAHRIRSFNGGYAFTSRSIVPGEYVTVKVLDEHPLYKGRLLFGFTSIDPTTLRSKDLGNMDKFSTGDEDEPRQIWSSNLSLSELGPSLTVRFRFDHLSYLICTTSDGIEHGIKMFDMDFNKRLWAFVNVYGSVGTVMLIDLPVLRNQNRTDRNIRAQPQQRIPRTNSSRIPILKLNNQNQNPLISRDRNPYGRSLC